MHVRTTRGLVQAVWMEVPWLDTLARGLCAKGGRRVAWERKSVTAKSLNPPMIEIQGDLKTSASAISEAENHKQAIAAEQASESQSLKGRFNQGPDEADSPRLKPLTSLTSSS